MAAMAVMIGMAVVATMVAIAVIAAMPVSAAAFCCTDIYEFMATE
jgi:hypothetical protein